MKNNKIHLLVIDPQVDFCDPTGSLYVPGAEKDMERLSQMVKRIGNKVSQIHVTLDSHRFGDIAHANFWKDSNGNHPNPFTLISVADVEKGKWTTSVAGLFTKALAYVKALDKGGKFPLVIWPNHCLIGSRGTQVLPVLFDALTEWEANKPGRYCNYVTKGSNPLTEHYSVFAAEVVDPSDPSTQLNTELIGLLADPDVTQILVAGEAKSHCVRNSLYDLIQNFPDPKYAHKMVILEDAMSSVPGFEKSGDDFFVDMKAKGVQFSNTVDFLK
jgi:nicotinamidase/pyrazinamidase